MLSSTSTIQYIGELDSTSCEQISEFLGHNSADEGTWAAFTKINSTFLFALSSNGEHFIRLPGHSASGAYYPIKEVTRYVESSGYVFISGFYLLHRMVAYAFLPDFAPYPEKEVNHKDGDKFNNNVTNLEMVTHADNMHHFFTAECMQDAKQVWVNKHQGTNYWTEDSRAKFMQHCHHTVSQSTRDKISAVHKGKKLSAAHVQRIREANTGNSYAKGKIWVTDGIHSTQIYPDKLVDWESAGYHRGRAPYVRTKPRPYQHTAAFMEKRRISNLVAEEGQNSNDVSK